LLMGAGLNEKAADSLKIALNFDPYNKTAADALNTALGIGGGKSPEDPAATQKPEQPL